MYKLQPHEAFAQRARRAKPLSMHKATITTVVYYMPIHMAKAGHNCLISVRGYHSRCQRFCHTSTEVTRPARLPSYFLLVILLTTASPRPRLERNGSHIRVCSATLLYYCCCAISERQDSGQTPTAGHTSKHRKLVLLF